MGNGFSLEPGYIAFSPVISHPVPIGPCAYFSEYLLPLLCRFVLLKIYYTSLYFRVFQGDYFPHSPDGGLD